VKALLASAVAFRSARESPALFAERVDVGIYGLFVAVMIFTISIHPNYGPYEIESLGLERCPWPLRRCASMRRDRRRDRPVDRRDDGVANVLAARYMLQHDFQRGPHIVLILVGGSSRQLNA